MSLNLKLNVVFEQFILNRVSDDLLKEIKDLVTYDQIDLLISKVQFLDDPSVYCKNDHDSDTPAGFFLFIDFISALIINLGDSTLQKMYQYKNIRHPFVPWVIRYVNDQRFHREIMSKFSQVFDE